MLKIYKRGEAPDAELVRREASGADVSGIVAGIIADVLSLIHISEPTRRS